MDTAAWVPPEHALGGTQASAMPSRALSRREGPGTLAGGTPSKRNAEHLAVGRDQEHWRGGPQKEEDLGCFVQNHYAEQASASYLFFFLNQDFNITLTDETACRYALLHRWHGKSPRCPMWLTHFEGKPSSLWLTLEKRKPHKTLRGLSMLSVEQCGSGGSLICFLRSTCLYHVFEYIT